MLDVQENMHMFLFFERNKISPCSHVWQILSPTVHLSEETSTRNICQVLHTLNSKSIYNSMKDFCNFLTYELVEIILFYTKHINLYKVYRNPIKI